MPSGKRRCIPSAVVNHDNRWRNASGVFRKAYVFFYYFRSSPSTNGNCRSEYRHRTKCLKVHYTHFTVMQIKSNSESSNFLYNFSSALSCYLYSGLTKILQLVAAHNRLDYMFVKQRATPRINVSDYTADSWRLNLITVCTVYSCKRQNMANSKSN